MTEADFINREIVVWGYDHIESLLERGYEPRLTTKGWTWIYAKYPAARESVLVGSLALAA